MRSIRSTIEAVVCKLPLLIWSHFYIYSWRIYLNYLLSFVPFRGRRGRSSAFISPYPLPPCLSHPILHSISVSQDSRDSICNIFSLVTVPLICSLPILSKISASVFCLLDRNHRLCTSLCITAALTTVPINLNFHPSIHPSNMYYEPKAESCIFSNVGESHLTTAVSGSLTGRPCVLHRPPAGRSFLFTQQSGSAGQVCPCSSDHLLPP